LLPVPFGFFCGFLTAFFAFFFVTGNGFRLEDKNDLHISVLRCSGGAMNPYAAAGSPERPDTILRINK
jgi:hypothetical protein